MVKKKIKKIFYAALMLPYFLYSTYMFFVPRMPYNLYMAPIPSTLYPKHMFYVRHISYIFYAAYKL